MKKGVQILQCFSTSADSGRVLLQADVQSYYEFKGGPPTADEIKKDSPLKAFYYDLGKKYDGNSKADGICRTAEYQSQASTETRIMVTDHIILP